MQTTLASNEMLQYFSQLNADQQRGVVNMLKAFLQNGKTEMPQTVEEYSQELLDADAQIEAGDFVEHEEVKRRFL